MASLLVYVAPEHLATVLGDGVRAPGRVVPLRRADLPGQLERLDERSTLFLITVERGRAVVVATLENPAAGDVVGEATLHDHDISELLVRLGCDKVWLVPAWASVPRIVPPNDVDLLRYTLGLALVEEQNADTRIGTPALPPPRVIDPAALLATDPAITLPAPRGAAQPAVPPQHAVSPRPEAPPAAPAGDPAAEELARALLAAIYAHPASDPPRRAYAAVLRGLGDPRGELIDLQLDRCRSGGPVTEREHELVRQHRSECAGSLRPVLVAFELARGFVSRCVVAESLVVSDELRADPAWATVEDIACIDLGLLTSEHLVSARTARVRGRDVATLAEHTGLLPFERLLPYSADAEPRGLVLDPANRPSVLEGGALTRVRVLKLDAVMLGARIEELMTSPFGRRLAHLDAWIDPEDAVRWRAVFDRVQLPLLTLRGSTISGSEILVSIERTEGAPRVIVQAAPDDAALHVARSLAHDLKEIEVSTPELFARLRSWFTTVTLRPRPSLAL